MLQHILYYIYIIYDNKDFNMTQNVINSEMRNVTVLNTMYMFYLSASVDIFLHNTTDVKYDVCRV